MNKHIVKHIVKHIGRCNRVKQTALYSFQSGLINKHTVKHIVTCMRGQYFIFGALCPSMSGLMNKHIVKLIVFGRLYSVGTLWRKLQVRSLSRLHHFKIFNFLLNSKYTASLP
jgi:hypothetical protein